MRFLKALDSKAITIIPFIFLFFFVVLPVEARSGCCSHHGGVMSNGCGCNDGTPLSNTCAPYYSCSQGSSVESAPIVIEPTATPYIPATRAPTRTPTRMPTKIPTRTPTEFPTKAPSPTLTASPTPEPTHVPASTPTPVNEVKKVKHTGFWDFILSFFRKDN